VTEVTTPTFEPIRTPRTFEAAVEHLVEGIERAGLRRGDRLPRLHELAAQLGISTPTLREAVSVLGQLGLVEVRQGKGGGIIVASDLVPAEAISTAVALEEQSAIDTLRARRLLETAVSRYVTLSATAKDLEPLDRANDLLERYLDQRNLVIRADSMFHRALARATKNANLEHAARGIGKSLYAIRDVYTGGRAESGRTLEVHRSQVAAMRERDLVAVATIVDRHLRALEESFAYGINRNSDELFGDARTAAEVLSAAPTASPRRRKQAVSRG
jgi:GntR family transcriptional regulator, transcriptional repressor for pyruvate dehydrogenase complex